MVKMKGQIRALLFFLTLFVMLFLSGMKAEAKTRGTVSIGNNVFSVEFENNKAAKAFIKKFPLTLKMSELNGNEKYKYLKSELPANEKAVKKIKAGDIMLYGSDCIVVFYESFSTDYKYTRLGRVTDTKGLSDDLGTGSVKVKFSKKPALNKRKVTLEEGETFALKLAGASSKKVKWKSSDKMIASVSKSGTVTAKKNGKAEVTAVYKKKEYNCIVTVKSAPEQNSTDSEAQPEPSSDGSDSMQDNVEQPEPSSGGSDNTIEESKESMSLKIDDRIVEVDWEENESVEALKNICREKPITIQMSMYGGFEQVGSIGQSISRNDEQTTTKAGDIVLYSGNQVVVFYGSNSWAYTRLGRITDKSDQELAEMLGNGDVTLSLFFWKYQE